MLKAIKILLKPRWLPLKSSVRHNPYPVTFHHMLRNMPGLQSTRLCNGLTIATEEREVCTACIGIFVDAGPRYESDFESGITHFFEHIAFKGTYARRRDTLEDQMSCTGARFRSRTRRDMAMYFAECLNQDVMLVTDILSDCVFNNAFNPSEIEAQKNIVYYEMRKHDEDLNLILDDYLHSTAFQGTTLARSVMGPSCNLYNFNSQTIPTFMNRFYDADRTVLVGVGGVKHEQMVALGNTYMGKLEPTKCIDSAIYRFTGSQVTWRNDDLPLANVAIAVEGPSLCDEDNVVMDVAKEMVGGWDRSQPAGIDHAWNIANCASTAPLADAYRGFNINYKDTGLWGVQFMGTAIHIDDMMHQVLSEWMHLCNSVTDVEVERAKRVLKTKLLSKAESMTRSCYDIGRWLLYQGYRPSLDEQLCAIDHVFASDVRHVMHQYVYDKCPAVAAVGPIEGLTDYVRTRASMYQLRL